MSDGAPWWGGPDQAQRAAREAEWRRKLAGQGSVRRSQGPDTAAGLLYEGIGKLAALGASDSWQAHRANEVEQSARDLGENTLGLETLQRSWNAIRNGKGGSLDYLNLGLMAAPGAGRSVGNWALRRLARNLEGTGAKDMGRALVRSRLPEGATPKGAPDPVAPGMTPREAAVPPEPVHPGSPYTAKQEGPYRAVRRQGARPQTTVAPHAYETKLSGLYDIHDDPEQLVQLARSYNLEATRKGARGAYLPDFARLVREYGYSGYKNPHFTGNQGAANVFDPVGDLKPIERGEKGYAEGGPVASLPVPGAVSLPLPEVV